MYFRDMAKGKNLQCAFCLKVNEDVLMIVSGAKASICNECVENATKIIEQELGKFEDKLDGKSNKKQAEQTKFNYKPIEINDYLDQYVIGQEDAKKVLSVAIYNHYKRLNQVVKDDIEIEKSNIIMVGETGSGKTLLAKSIAKMLNVPFAIADATVFTEAGYVGEDVESILSRLLQAADYDVEQAQKGIVFIDEIDKLGRKSDNPSITRDVSGEGVQQGLLKMIEGSVVRVPASDKRKHPKGDMNEIDTRGILFICGGAFVGLDKIVQRRKDSNTIGFHSEVKSKEEASEYYGEVSTKDLITYGMIPEFVGRFGIITNVDELSITQLVQILKEPKSSLVKQYQYLFELDGIELEFDDDAFLSVAGKAKELKTNARGLKNILEKTLLPYQFDAINLVERGLHKIVISKTSVEGNPATLIFNKNNDKKSS